MASQNKNYMLNDKFPKQIKNATSTSDGLMSSEDKAKIDELFEFGLLAPATPDKNGVMTKEDKAKLDGIEDGANKYIHPIDENTRHVTDEQIEYWNKNVSRNLSFNTVEERDSYVENNQLEYGSIVTVKENNGSSYQYLNNEFREIRFATDGFDDAVYDGLDSDSTTTALTARQGKVLNTKINSHATNTSIHVTEQEKSVWNSKATTNVATQTADGLMSKSDKIKLDSIASGAGTHPDTHPATMIEQDSTHRFVTDTQIKSWDDAIAKIQELTQTIAELDAKLRSAVFYG